MALDTGSPGMIISFDLAERLGLFSRGDGALVVSAGGIGGRTPAVRTILDSVAIEGATELFVPTKVIESLSPAFEGLVGMDFMTNYTVSIDSRKHVVVLQETSPGPDIRGGHDEEWWRKYFEEFRSARDEWTEYADSLQRLIEQARMVSGPAIDTLKFAQAQARGAERLYQRLDTYASNHAVPRHWR